MDRTSGPVNVKSETCKLCGKPADSTAIAENGGKVSVCGECAEKSRKGEIRIVWVEKEMRSKRVSMKLDKFIGGHYEAVCDAD